MSDLPRWRIVMWTGDREHRFWSHFLEFSGFYVAFRFDGSVAVEQIDQRRERWSDAKWKVLYQVEEGHDGRYLRSPRQLPHT